MCVRVMCVCARARVCVCVRVCVRCARVCVCEFICAHVHARSKDRIRAPHARNTLFCFVLSPILARAIFPFQKQTCCAYIYFLHLYIRTPGWERTLRQGHQHWGRIFAWVLRGNTHPYQGREQTDDHRRNLSMLRSTLSTYTACRFHFCCR